MLGASIEEHRFTWWLPEMVIRVLVVLLDHGANFGARDLDGYTPLGFAASKDSPEVLSVLLASGADANTRGCQRQPYMKLLSIQPIQTIIAITDAGADGTLVNDDGKTPFDLAEENDIKGYSCPQR